MINVSFCVVLIAIAPFDPNRFGGVLRRSGGHRVPVYSRNWHDIVFRSVEVGVALWFPCCLWNSMKPEQLWILNPRRLLRRQVDPVSGGAGGSSSIERVSFAERCLS